MHLAKIFYQPKYRVHSGGKYGFLNDYFLSGTEKKLILAYEFKDTPCEIIARDYNWDEIYRSKKEVTN